MQGSAKRPNSLFVQPCSSLLADSRLGLEEEVSPRSLTTNDPPSCLSCRKSSPLLRFCASVAAAVPAGGRMLIKLTHRKERIEERERWRIGWRIGWTPTSCASNFTPLESMSVRNPADRAMRLS